MRSARYVAAELSEAMSPCRCHQAPVPSAQVPRGGGRPCARRRMPIISPVRYSHPGQECEITAGASRGDTQGTCRCHRHPATPSGAPPREPGAPHPQGEAAGAALTPLTLLEAWRDGGGGAGGQAPVGTMARGWGSAHGPWHPVGTFRCAHTCDTRAGTHVFMHAHPCARAHAYPSTAPHTSAGSDARTERSPHTPLPPSQGGFGATTPGSACWVAAVPKQGGDTVPSLARWQGATQRGGQPLCPLAGWPCRGGDPTVGTGWHRAAVGGVGGAGVRARGGRGAGGAGGGTPWPGKGWHAAGEQPHENTCHAGRRGGKRWQKLAFLPQTVRPDTWGGPRARGGAGCPSCRHLVPC